jgi:hypothetical protein
MEGFTMAYKTINTLQLNKINTTAKEQIYTKLLNGIYNAQITIDIGKDKPNLYNVDAEFLSNDCCISSWTLNFYTRTNKAVKNERYKTLGTCLRALKRLANKHKIRIVSNLRVYKKVNFKYSDGTKDFYNCHLFSIEL